MAQRHRSQKDDVINFYYVNPEEAAEEMPTTPFMPCSQLIESLKV